MSVLHLLSPSLQFCSVFFLHNLFLPSLQFPNITLYNTMLNNRESDFSTDEGVFPRNIIGLKGVMAEHRPLVHVFLIQESMPLDALVAVS